jgi:glycosyltransferase involved in cell wall biosynthesis
MNNQISPDISVVVPVRNEAGNIETLVNEIAAALTPCASFEIIYVNDGSTDMTADVLHSLRQSKPFLRHLHHDMSCGQSAAVRTGVRAARGELIFTLDGDGQNDPSFMPAFLAAFKQAASGYGLVQGQRLGRKDTAFKRLQSRIANKVRSAILGDGTRDTGCGFRCFPKSVYLSLPYFDALHRFMPALVRREGFEIVYVNVVDRPRLSGVSNYGFFDRLWVGIVDLMGVRWLIQRRRRIPVVQEII